MDFQKLKETVRIGSALRFRARLQPAGGPGDKVFPATYEKGAYALETRLIDGRRIPCIHLDSVQSQANRMELALLEAARAGKIELPIVQVDFAAKDPELKEVGTITSLEAPHRLADAILRDSAAGGKRFRDLPEGKVLETASIQNAAGLFEICPTALLFGIWDSTGPKGGLGVKFQRCIVSELVAIDAEVGIKSSSRIDPLGIVLNAGPIYASGDASGFWTLDPKDASGKANPKLGKEGKPSEVNHGNVTPSLTAINGGVTFDHALHMVVISLPALRRLHFPVESHSDPVTDLIAQTVLAALGLGAACLSQTSGYDLRSRCLLIPEKAGTWEAISADGTAESFELDAGQACALVMEAVVQARKAGLKWRAEPFTLLPSDGLAELVRRSRALAMQSKTGD